MNVKRLMTLIAAVAAATLAGPARSATTAAKPVGSAVFTESIKGTLVKFDMVRVPAGEIPMPDPDKKGASQRVNVGPLWVGKTEVTWDEFDVFVFRLDDPNAGPPPRKAADATSRPSKPYGMADRGYGHKGYPVMNVSFQAADAYCKWLSKKTGRKYRLPTEVEWEYACRAGKPEPAGNEQLSQVAWFRQEKTQPVGKKSPNAWGLYDMLGNVGEWCVDLKGKPVLCGGSYEDKAEGVRCTTRRYQDESWQENDPQEPKSRWWLSDGTFAGFRVVRGD